MAGATDPGQADRSENGPPDPGRSEDGPPDAGRSADGPSLSTTGTLPVVGATSAPDAAAASCAASSAASRSSFASSMADFCLSGVALRKKLSTKATSTMPSATQNTVTVACANPSRNGAASRLSAVVRNDVLPFSAPPTCDESPFCAAW